MASSRRKRAEPSVDAAALEAALDRCRERLLVEGALRLSALKPLALREGIVARLTAEGVEVTKTWLRRPLAEQLRAALAHGATLAKKPLLALVRGASATELQRVLREAEQRGELRRVWRGKVEAFTGAGTPALATQQLTALRAALSGLERALGAALRKKGSTLLVSDVDEALAEARRVLEPRGAAAEVTPRAGVAELEERGAAAELEPRGAAAELAPSAGEPSGNGQGLAPGGSRDERTQVLAPLLAALDATRDERTGLSFVPNVVARLLSEMPAAAAHEVLLAAARRELIELRPEGGLGRLTPEELVLCPPGPGGTRLSWARRLSGGPP